MKYVFRKYGGGSINSSVTKEMTQTKTKFHFRKPTKEDGAAVWNLINDMGVLDLNSSYSYIMWCEIFAETSIVAERDGETVGFISGFIHQIGRASCRKRVKK